MCDSGWLGIETAPRDGTHILIRFGSDWTSSASYHRNEDDAHPWKFLDSQGQGLPIINGARDDKYGPSHWAPLPLPNPPGEKGSETSQSQPCAETGTHIPSSPEVQRALDQCWRAVDALGAPETARVTDDDRAYCRAVGDAIIEIEKLGGKWS